MFKMDKEVKVAKTLVNVREINRFIKARIPKLDPQLLRDRYSRDLVYKLIAGEAKMIRNLGDH